MSFSDDLAAFSADITTQANARVKRVALAAFEQINQNSPVDKGTFRANWNVSVGGLDRSVDLSKTAADVQETQSIANTKIMNQAKLGESVFISNSVPYAIALEDGYSPQAEAGVVDPAITVIRNAIASGQL